MRTTKSALTPACNQLAQHADMSGSQTVAAEQAGREARAETNTAALKSCTGLAPGVTNLPIDQIRQTVRPTADQEVALGNLSAASSQASEIIKSSCPASVPLTPIGRLDAAEQRLDATIKAIRMVLSPLERFYVTLSDEQRGRFNAMNGSTEGARSPSDMAALCSQQAGSFIDLPAQRVEQVIQLTAQQQSAFDDLKKASQKESILGNHQRTSLFLCSVSFPLFRAYDAQLTRGHEMGKCQKWHGVKQRQLT
jgi:LTXXQ motif family protein